MGALVLLIIFLVFKTLPIISKSSLTRLRSCLFQRMPLIQSMSKAYHWMPVRGKSLTFSGPFKASRPSASFLGRKSPVRRSFSALLISSQLCKQRSSLILFKDIDLIEMIFWDCNFLTRPSTISIKTTKVVIFRILKMILTTKIILILEEIIFILPRAKVGAILAQLASLVAVQSLVHRALKIITAAHPVKTIKIAVASHSGPRLISFSTPNNLKQLF